MKKRYFSSILVVALTMVSVKDSFAWEKIAIGGGLTISSIALALICHNKVTDCERKINLFRSIEGYCGRDSLVEVSDKTKDFVNRIGGSELF